MALASKDTTMEESFVSFDPGLGIRQPMFPSKRAPAKGGAKMRTQDEVHCFLHLCSLLDGH